MTEDFSPHSYTWRQLSNDFSEDEAVIERSDKHLRMNIVLDNDSLQPVMVWRGVSTSGDDWEVVHIASPLSGTSSLVDIARELDTMPCGGLRILDGGAHVHHSMPLCHCDAPIMKNFISLVARVASQLCDDKKFDAQNLIKINVSESE
ncbi:MAG: hypothetical protein J6M18_02150 [Actinomycetaceae bacterium]|nr:hypothetical protein [Actinomycetaceae bacterium]